MEATKTVSLDVNTILKLQDKLTSIKNKIHYWSAKSKGIILDIFQLLYD